MADELQTGETPLTQPIPAAEPTPTPAPVAEEPQKPTTPDASKDPGEVDAEGYAKLKEDWLKNGAPLGEEPAPASAQPPQEPAPEKEPEPAPPDDTEEVVPGEKFRPRLGKLPPIQKEAIALVRQMNEEGKTIDLAEAERRIKAKYGVDDAKPADPANPAQPAPKSVTAIDDEIKSLREQKREAAKAVDTIRMQDLDDQIETLREEKEQAKEAQMRQQQQFVAQFEDSKSKARQTYPDIAKADSDLAKKFIELDARFQAQGNPIVNSHDYPFRLTQMAANELAIVPVDPNAKPTPKPAAAKPSASTPPQAATRPVQPASGSARSAVQPTATAQLSAELDAAKTPEDYERVKAKILASLPA